MFTTDLHVYFINLYSETGQSLGMNLVSSPDPLQGSGNETRMNHQMFLVEDSGNKTSLSSGYHAKNKGVVSLMKP